MTPAERIGIFGGSFDPPHLGHLLVAETAREQFALDRVVWIPAAAPPHKRHDDLSDSVHRLAMVERAVRSNPAFECSSMEIDRGDTSYTVDTLEHLAEEAASNDYFLILGSDSYHDFQSWRRPSRIVELAHLLVYPRGDGDHAASTSFAFQAVDAPMIPISSTMIRTKVRLGASVRYYVPDDVLSYIEGSALYR